MKADKQSTVVQVQRDSAPFTTVRFEDRKHAIATKYGVFWSMISRRIF